MERLTKIFATTSCNNKVKKQFLLPEFSGDTDYQQKMVDKLGNIEDIEEEMGIDIITLFKALKDGIWVKQSDINTDNLTIHKVNSNDLIYDYNVLHKCFETDEETYDFLPLDLELKDYGKTWALTEGELGNE